MYCLSCGTQMPDSAQFCHRCGNKTALDNISSVTVSERNVPAANAKEVKKYLACAKRLETHKYTIIETYNQLQYRIDRLGNPRNFNYPQRNVSLKRPFIVGAVLFFILGFFISLFILAKGDFSRAVEIFFCLILVVTLISLPDGLICLGVGIGSGIAGGILFGILAFMKEDSIYKEEVKKYNKALADDKKRVQRELKQIEFLKKQQEELREKYNDVEKVMEKFYALNVVYPKYRDLIPIVTFYEYFESGRHTTLTDAYNKYEDELLHKTIIQKLDVVISQLEQIKRNQAALYEVIMESISIAERICSQSDELIASNKIIEQNTALAAYNAKIAADNSTINAYINVCRL